MRIKLILITATACLLGITSCKKWLNVQPQDKFTETQVFKDEAGAQLAVNGLYLKLTQNSLYGVNLSMGMVEIFAQRFNVGGQHGYAPYQQYNYGSIAPGIQLMWEQAYATIANANEFLKNLDKYPGMMPASHDSILRGEAIAIRAMLHFDMLRLFGPVYNTADSVSISVPYYRVASPAVQALLPANQVMDSILADLHNAAQLLRSDPVIASGRSAEFIADGRNFYRNRHQRLNYYAVKALQARAFLYRNDKTNAYAAAKFVIDSASKWFAWTSIDILSNPVNPDRIMSSEVLFAPYCSNLYNNHKSLFSEDLTETSILTPNSARLSELFENNENDYRYNPNWIFSNSGTKAYKTFYKYADVADKNSGFRFLIPLIRLSEMYYIAAECETNSVTAIQYLDTVRLHRGLTSLPPAAGLSTELIKEYRREFFGEGQLFFFYKRENITTLPNSASTNPNSTVTLNKAKFVLPLPVSETVNR